MSQGTEVGCGMFVFLVSLIIAAQFFIVWLIQLAWNFIAPVFNGPQLGYWQVFAIYFILGIICGCFKKVTSIKQE